MSFENLELLDIDIKISLWQRLYTGNRRRQSSECVRESKRRRPLIKKAVRRRYVMSPDLLNCFSEMIMRDIRGLEQTETEG